MPSFESSVQLAHTIEEIFTFFTRPANLVQLAPPDAEMKLAAGPELLHKGAQLTWNGKRFGVPQQMTVEVTHLSVEERITYTQRRGPLGKWIHTQQFTATDAGTQINDLIEFEPPGGMLGFLVTPGLIHGELESIFEHRVAKLMELFPGGELT